MKPRLTIRRAVPVLVLLVLVTALVLFTQPSALSVLKRRLQANQSVNRDMQALFQIEALAAQSAWTPELALAAGDIWAGRGDVNRAAAYWETAASLSPGAPDVLRGLAGAYLELQQWPQAGDTLRQLVGLKLDDTWARWHLALLEAPFNPLESARHLRVASSDPLYREVALDLLSVVGDADTDSATAMAVGVTLAGHNLWPYAELAFEHAAALGEPFPEALAYTGLARDRQGKDGSPFFDQAVALAPENAAVRYLQGLHLRSLFDDAGSLAAFAQAASLAPDNPAYAAELGAAYQLVGNLGQAEYWLNQAVTLSQNDPRFVALLDAFYAQFNTN